MLRRLKLQKCQKLRNATAECIHMDTIALHPPPHAHVHSFALSYSTLSVEVSQPQSSDVIHFPMLLTPIYLGF